MLAEQGLQMRQQGHLADVGHAEGKVSRAGLRRKFRGFHQRVIGEVEDGKDRLGDKVSAWCGLHTLADANK